MRKFITIIALLISMAGFSQETLPTLTRSINDFRLTADRSRIFLIDGSWGGRELAWKSDVLARVKKVGDTLSGTLRAQSIIPLMGNTVDLGASSLRFRRSYLNSIIAQNISPLTDNTVDNLYFTKADGTVTFRQMNDGTWNFGPLGSSSGFTLQVQGTLNITDQAFVPTPLTSGAIANKAYVDARAPIVVSATIDFEATPPNSSDFKPVAFTGAAVGDAFIIGATSLATSNYNLLARCTTAGTVSVVFYNNDPTLTVNPSSTTITIKKLP